MKKIYGLFLLIGLLFVSMSAKAQNTTPDSVGYLVKVGQVAPDFEMQLTNGEKVKLSSLRGKVVMLQFTASWCGVCRKEMPFIEKDIWQKHKGDKGFALTSSMMISTSNSSFFVPYGVVKKISYPGFFSKELKITTNSGQIFSLKLSQSAAGQKKIFDILKAYLKNIG